MNSLTDKQRCELSFVGRIIYLLILGGIDGECKEKLLSIALEVSEEPLIDVYNKMKIKRRVIRMEKNTIRLFSYNAHGEKVILICYYFINMLVDSGQLIIPEDSLLAHLVEYLLSLIDTSDPVVQKRMSNAEKQARKWIGTLQEEGYYR